MTVTAEQILFWAFAVCTVASAVVVVAARNPIGSAMALVATFFFLAGIYVLLWAHTIAVLQILVYAGAVMVLFLFVIMLLSLPEVGPVTKLTLSRILGGLGTLALMGLLATAMYRLKLGDAAVMPPARLGEFGTLAKMGEQLYTVWLLPFEAVSLLLLVAIVGAVVVAKSRI